MNSSMTLDAAEERPAGGALRHRDFRLYLAAWFFANVGAQMLSVAVGWQVYALTHRALDLGWVGLVQFVPAFGFSMLAGELADRFDRARIVAICNLALGCCALALCAFAACGAGVLPIYAILFFVGTTRAFSAPAGQALAAGLVPAEDFPRAVTWVSTIWQVAVICGPALGGALYAMLHGAAWVHASCAAVLVLASASMFSVRARPVSSAAARTPSRDTILAGLRYVRARRVILGSISLDLFAVLLGGASALLPVYASDVLHVGPIGLGALRSAPAVGAAGMALWLGRRPLARRAGSTMLACVALYGAAIVVFGLSRSFALSLAALLVTGAADMVSVVVRSTVVQLQTPHDMRGRVSAVNMMFIVASSELGELESGMTAALVGAVPAVILGGIGTVVVAAVYALIFPELRRIDELTESL